eukprot:gene24270-27455_t
MAQCSLAVRLATHGKPLHASARPLHIELHAATHPHAVQRAVRPGLRQGRQQQDFAAPGLHQHFQYARRAAVLGVLAPVLKDADSDAALRFQQTSGMVMAKGVEDTAFYRYSRLTSLNEVGGDPSVFSVSTD